MKTTYYAVAAGALVALLTGCHRAEEAGSKPEKELPAATVSAREVTAGTHRATEDVVGTVRARLRAVIEAKVSGRIVRLPVAPGQAVAMGDLLAELDVAEFKARVEQAQAVLEQATRELARFQALLKQEAVTQAEYDAVESRHRVARAAVEEAQTMVGYATITAPFAGIVTRKPAEVGDLATPGRPLVEIEDPGSLRFEADVPVTLGGQARLGDRLPVTLSTVPEPVEGVVSEIDPAADPVSRTFRLRLDLPTDCGARAGLFGRVAIPLGESAILTVPSEAVVVRGQLELVFVVTDGRASMRLVKTGKRLGSDVEILAGLEPKERVVISGAAGLADGQPVVVR